MLDQPRAETRPEQRREQLFIERYESLLAFAIRLTDQYHEAADLVQEAFVQFMLGRTGLEQIENIDGYLRRMLRYMNSSRISRQAKRLSGAALSVADFDSLTLGWTAIEAPRRMQAFEELQQICSYACARKESSRAGSVLILRYFHEFLPTEIAAVIGSSRHCVDQLHALARREAKVFLDEPERLRFVAKSGGERAVAKKLVSSGDLMTELRELIFVSCQGVCPSPEELREIYVTGNTSVLTTSKLAHIVSCPLCLEAVNTLLEFPPLASRYRTDSTRPPGGGSGGSGGGGGVSRSGPSEVRKKLTRHLREISEHKPQELRISVNGLHVGSLKISSDMTELDLNLNEDEPVEFVEITSEQDVLLLLLSSGSGSRSEQWAWIELSENRTLAAFLRLHDGPSLRVVYTDPSLSLNQELSGSTSLSSSLSLVPAVDETIAARVVIDRLVRLLRSWSGALGFVKRADGSASTADPGELLPDRGRLWTRPGFVAVLLVATVAIGLAAFLIWRSRVEPTPAAVALLDEAEVAEQRTEQLLDRASRRFLNLEERRSPDGAVVSRRRIEIWRNYATGDRVHRLYDESNQLVAATWQKGDGSRLVYHHGMTAQPQAAPATWADLLVNLEDVWQFDPSAKTFADLIAEPDALRVERQSTAYLLTYEKQRAIGASQLLKATLTLSQTDLRPIEQALLVQRGGELREYRFVEASFELLPVKAVDQKVFEVEPELIGGSRPTGRPGDFARRDLTSSRVPPPKSASVPAVASAELEVDVAYLLNQAKADRNEQVALTRNAGGSLRVEGIVDHEQRKQEMLKALAPVSGNPAVVIDIRTIDEAMKRANGSRQGSVYQTEETASTIAVDRELRAYFSKAQGDSADLDEAVGSFSSRTVNRAYRALFQAIALERLLDRFANVDMRSIAPDARAKWLSMIREHAAAFERETATLREDLQPIFFAGAPSGAVEEFEIDSDAKLAAAVERLHKLALASNESIRAAFTISSRSSGKTLKSSFWRLSAQAQLMAQAIARYANE